MPRHTKRVTRTEAPPPQLREYRPHPSIVPFHESHAQVKALCGPAGSGKSLAAGFEIFLTGCESTVPLRAVVIRESYRQLHDSTRRTLEEWFGGCSDYHKGDERLLITAPNFKGDVLTHELDFRHCRRPEDVSNLLSTEYGVIWLEEPVPAYQMEAGVIGAGLPKELFDMASMRLRQRDLHRLEILLTFNPPSAFHWIYQEFFKPKADDLAANDYALFRCKPYENAPNLPTGYYEKMLSRLGEDLARRFVLGEVVTLYPGERVYREFYEQTHFAENLQPAANLPLVLMFDFGRTPCALIAQVLPSSRMVIYRELQLWDAGTEKFAEQLKEVLKNEFPAFSRWRCWADPAGAYRHETDERSSYQILAQHNFNCQAGAESNATRQEAVIQRTQRFIEGKPAILIDKDRCPILMEGLLGGYRYPKSHDGQVGKAPLKNRFSHTCNALEYGCSGEFSITTGEARQTEKEKQRPQYDPFRRTPAPRRSNWMSR